MEGSNQSCWMLLKMRWALQTPKIPANNTYVRLSALIRNRNIFGLLEISYKPSWVFFSFLRLLPYPGAALGVKAYIWRTIWIFTLFLQNPLPEGSTFSKFPFETWNWNPDFLQKLLPEGSGFEMEIQIQTRLINAIWGPKSENWAKMPIAYSLFPIAYCLLPIALLPGVDVQISDDRYNNAPVVLCTGHEKLFVPTDYGRE